MTTPAPTEPTWMWANMTHRQRVRALIVCAAIVLGGVLLAIALVGMAPDPAGMTKADHCANAYIQAGGEAKVPDRAGWIARCVSTWPDP